MNIINTCKWNNFLVVVAESSFEHEFEKNVFSKTLK